MLAEFGGVFLAISFVIYDDIVSLGEMYCHVQYVQYVHLRQCGAQLAGSGNLQANVQLHGKDWAGWGQPCNLTGAARSSGRLAAPGESMERRERFWISRCR